MRSKIKFIQGALYLMQMCFAHMSIYGSGFDALMPYKEIIHTITADNGKEFDMYEKISQQLDYYFYFAKPYHSWARGANENTNGLIQQYFPKKTDFATVTDEQVQWVEDKLNNRPRKRFNFETPNAIFNKLTNQEKVAFVTWIHLLFVFNDKMLYVCI